MPLKDPQPETYLYLRIQILEAQKHTDPTEHCVKYLENLLSTGTGTKRRQDGRWGGGNVAS